MMRAVSLFLPTSVYPPVLDTSSRPLQQSPGLPDALRLLDYPAELSGTQTPLPKPATPWLPPHLSYVRASFLSRKMSIGGLISPLDFALRGDSVQTSAGRVATATAKSWNCVGAQRGLPLTAETEIDKGSE